ncbi:MAG: hypothetical protein U0Q08_07520 [Dermatophilaceae bacterium]
MAGPRSSTCAAAASAPARATSRHTCRPAQLTATDALIALVGADGLTLGLPAIAGGIAAWRAAGMPLG